MIGGRICLDGIKGDVRIPHIGVILNPNLKEIIMSEEMAKKKEEDIKQLEEEELAMSKEMENDKCPLCGTLTKDFQYVVMLPPPMGWLECPTCGNVFCPDSIRRRKVKARSSPLILPA
jgi:hypothetical protein